MLRSEYKYAIFSSIDEFHEKNIKEYNSKQQILHLDIAKSRKRNFWSFLESESHRKQ